VVPSQKAGVEGTVWNKAGGSLVSGTRDEESQANVPPETLLTDRIQAIRRVSEQCFKWYAWTWAGMLWARVG